MRAGTEQMWLSPAGETVGGLQMGHSSHPCLLGKQRGAHLQRGTNKVPKLFFLGGGFSEKGRKARSPA